MIGSDIYAIKVINDKVGISIEKPVEINDEATPKSKSTKNF